MSRFDPKNNNPNHSGLLRMVTGKGDPSQIDLEVPRPTSSTNFPLAQGGTNVLLPTLRRRTVRQHVSPKKFFFFFAINRGGRVGVYSNNNKKKQFMPNPSARSGPGLSTTPRPDL